MHKRSKKVYEYTTQGKAPKDNILWHSYCQCEMHNKKSKKTVKRMAKARGAMFRVLNWGREIYIKTCPKIFFIFLGTTNSFSSTEFTVLEYLFYKPKTTAF